MNPVRNTFKSKTIVLPLDRLTLIRPAKPSDNSSGKYGSIMASIQAIGLVEPLVVHPQEARKGFYLLLDGHVRYRALVELGIQEASCMVSTEDDAFTYNDKVSRVAPIQEHRMIMRAIAQGVTTEQIAQALNLNPERIREGMSLLKGIHADAIEILKDKPITSGALRVFKKVKPPRQLDFAQLMVSMNNYSIGYARALLIGTASELLTRPEKPKAVGGIKSEDMAQMEKEMETLERDFKAYQNTYGEDALTLNVVQRYVKRLVENPQVQRFLTKRYPEIQEELVDLAGMESI